jgi:hypothetical protein
MEGNKNIRKKIRKTKYQVRKMGPKIYYSYSETYN